MKSRPGSGRARRSRSPYRVRKREDIASPQSTGIERRVDAVWQPATDGREPCEHRSQPIQVGSIEVEADVEVLRDEWRSVGLRCEPSDDHELDAPFDQGAQEVGGREARVLAHSATLRSDRRKPAWRSSTSSACASRSAGVSASKARICVRSTPMPSRGIDLEAVAAALEEPVQRADPWVDPPGLDAGDRLLRDADLRGQLTLGQPGTPPRVSGHPSGHGHHCVLHDLEADDEYIINSSRDGRATRGSIRRMSPLRLVPRRRSTRAPASTMCALALLAVVIAACLPGAQMPGAQMPLGSRQLIITVTNDSLVPVPVEVAPMGLVGTGGGTGQQVGPAALGRCRAACVRAARHHTG